MFPYINLLHDILKDRNPFPFIRMPSQPPGAKPPDSRGAFGPRQDQDSRACDRGVRRMLTRMAHQPVDNGILHEMRRFARRPWRSAKRAQAHATSPHRFRQHRTQHRTRPASVRPERTPFAIQRTHPSERTPLPSPSPGKAQSTSWYQQLTRTYIAPKPSIMRNKG